MEDYKKIIEQMIADGAISQKVVEKYCPEFQEDKDEKIRKALIAVLKSDFETNTTIYDISVGEIIEWLDKLSKKTNPYSGISFEYNGHIWGMCARDNGVDILLDKQLFKHLEKQSTNKECLKGIKRVQEYQDLSNWEKKFDNIASMYAHNKNQEGYNNSWYVKERAAAMLYHAKEELKRQGEQKPTDKAEPNFKADDKLKQTRKDLELTVDDIKSIDRFLNQCVDCSNPYQEVLKRFNEHRQKK